MRILLFFIAGWLLFLINGIFNCIEGLMILSWSSKQVTFYFIPRFFMYTFGFLDFLCEILCSRFGLNFFKSWQFNEVFGLEILYAFIYIFRKMVWAFPLGEQLIEEIFILIMIDRNMVTLMSRSFIILFFDGAAGWVYFLDEKMGMKTGRFTTLGILLVHKLPILIYIP